MSEGMKRVWKVLNECYGIYTKEQLRKEMKNTVLDIGIFTTLLETDKHCQEP